MFNIFRYFREYWHSVHVERNQEELVAKCGNLNIQRIDGIDYLTYNDIIISRPSDNDLLDRMAYIRERIMTDGFDGL